MSGLALTTVKHVLKHPDVHPYYSRRFTPIGGPPSPNAPRSTRLGITPKPFTPSAN